MMQVGVTVSEAGTGSRLGRLPFVLLLTVSLLVSLIHCAGCDLGFSSANATADRDELTRAPPRIRLNNSCRATAGIVSRTLPPSMWQPW